MRVFHAVSNGMAIVCAVVDQMEKAPIVPYKVLVVEDDHSMRLLLTSVLTQAGYEVIAVSTLETAMKALTAEAPDALVADVQLDGYNGLQLVAMCPRPIPAIMVTGTLDAGLEREARQLGADYLLKPIEPSTLVAILDQKLTGVAQNGQYAAVRKSVRTRVGAEVQVLGAAAARVVDVSYEGLRLQIERTTGPWLPLAFDIAFPSSDIVVPVDVVWKRRAGEAIWLCGAAVPPEHQDTWRVLVDNLVGCG